MKISVIVPVYNVEKYLRKCLDSIVSQTFSDIEVIVVNDGTTDNSQKIIEEYEKKYSFVKGYIKENGGLSDARNYGIERASGDYLAFVDSDDYIDIHMYERMYKKAVEGDYDMVVCDFTEVYNDHNAEGSSRLEKDLETSDEVKKHMVDFYPSAWNKLFKRELFRELRFKKSVWFEDVELCYRLLPYVRSVGVVKEPLYYYIQREGSISKSADPRIYHCIDNWNGIVEFYQKNDLYQTFFRELEYNYVRYMYATFVKAALKFDMNGFEEAVRSAQKNVKVHFPQYRRNPYFYKNMKGMYLLGFNRWLAWIYYKVKN